MKNLLLWALIVLNALLLISFLGRVTGDNQAVAQVRGGGNTNQTGRGNAVNAADAGPGDYLIIPATITGVSGDMVFVVDTTHNWLSAMIYDDTRNELATMPRIDLERIWEQAERERTEPRRGGGGGRP
jgi:hypothetical protein